MRWSCRWHCYRFRRGVVLGVGMWIALLLWLAASQVVLAAPAGSDLSAASSPVQGPVRAPHLSVNLIALSDSIRPGGDNEAGLHFLLDPGWHVYWVNAGDSGEPPHIHWTLPAGITAGAMQFPAPKRLPLGPLMDFGYESEVLFPIPLRAAPNLKAPAPGQLHAHVDWLVCREVCIPGKADLVLPLQISYTPKPPDQATLALFQRFRAMLPKPLPSSARASFAMTQGGFTVAFRGLPRSADADSAEFFPLGETQIANAAPQPVKRTRDGFNLSLKKDEKATGVPSRLDGVLVLGSTAYEVHALPGTAAEGTGQLAALPRIAVLAFLGGVLLNLMPCVLPVLFIKGLALVQSSHEERSRQRTHGLVYALGILVSFWAVVGVLLGLRAAGHTLGWGFQFQSPGFLAVIALLLFFLALSLAGMFEIGLTVTSAGSGLAAKQGYTGSFFTGVLAMVVATPCTAPFMGAAIGFALAQPAWIAFAVFTALALGLAMPYLLLTLNPAWTRLLPRPGAWMEVLKQLTSIPIFAVVIWLVWLFTQAAGANALAGLLAGFLVLAIAGWILGRWPARRTAGVFAAAIIALAVAAPLYALRLFPVAAEHAGQSAGGSRDIWQPFTQTALEQYRSEGKPVFVDFTAAWCLSCQVNERVVLDREDVQRRLRDSGVVLMRADWTRRDEQIAQALSELGRNGVPTYALYAPGAPAQLLPEVLTPGIVISALDNLQTKQEKAGQ